VAKLTLSDIAAGYAAPTRINANNDAIEAALENTLSRDGTDPNNMESDLDMDTHRIINLDAPANSTDAARWIDVTDAVNLTGTAVPALTGNSQKYLGTDGSSLGWKNFYDQTAAESAASVTPTDYRYPSGDVRRYGATGDGSTDDTSAIASALSVAAASKGTVLFPAFRNGQTIYLSGKQSVGANIHIVSEPGVIIRSTITNANDHVFECISTLGTGTALTANAAPRDISVTVTSVSGLSAGMIVIIRDNNYKYGTTGRNMELNEIDSIASLTVTLKNRLIGTYATASSAQLVPLTTAVRDVKFENVYVDIPSSKDGGAFYFQESYNCDVVNCRSTGQKGQPGVGTWRSAYIRVTQGDYSNGQSQSTPGYGYGINFGEASHHCVARGVTFKNVRECAVSGNVRYSGYIDCVSIGSYDNAFNAHAMGAEDCYFIGCKSYEARSKGFYAGGITSQAPDKRIRFINCHSHYSGYMGFWADGASGVESEDIEFINCKSFHAGDDTATSYGIYLFRSKRPRVLNCSIDGDGEANARALIKAEICTDAVIRGNTCRSATSGWGIIHANCTGVVIDDNTIGNIGSSQGVYAESTASTSVYVRLNKIDNDTPFTRNTGDHHEFNEYNTKRERNSGAAASTADGGTITHGLVSTPTVIKVQTTISREAAAVTSVGGTTFTIAIKKDDGTAGTTQTIYWEAWY
jgi:hypothetical protein